MKSPNVPVTFLVSPELTNSGSMTKEVTISRNMLDVLMEQKRCSAGELDGRPGILGRIRIKAISGGEQSSASPLPAPERQKTYCPIFTKGYRRRMPGFHHPR